VVGPAVVGSVMTNGVEEFGTGTVSVDVVVAGKVAVDVTMPEDVVGAVVDVVDDTSNGTNPVVAVVDSTVVVGPAVVVGPSVAVVVGP